MSASYSLVISPAEQVDADALFALMHDSVHRVGLRAYSPEQLAAWSPAPRTGDEARARLKAQTLFIAEDELGYAAFQSLTPIGYLDFLYAHPRAVGKGAASMLYDALEAHAREASLSLLTSDVSLIARPFLEKRGWKRIMTQHPVRNGVELTNFLMMKRLAS